MVCYWKADCVVLVKFQHAVKFSSALGLRSVFWIWFFGLFRLGLLCVFFLLDSIGSLLFLQSCDEFLRTLYAAKIRVWRCIVDCVLSRFSRFCGCLMGFGNVGLLVLCLHLAFSEALIALHMPQVLVLIVKRCFL
jgi:hypothetical protein